MSGAGSSTAFGLGSGVGEVEATAHNSRPNNTDEKYGIFATSKGGEGRKVGTENEGRY